MVPMVSLLVLSAALRRYITGPLHPASCYLRVFIVPQPRRYRGRRRKDTFRDGSGQAAVSHWREDALSLGAEPDSLTRMTKAFEGENSKLSLNPCRLQVVPDPVHHQLVILIGAQPGHCDRADHAGTTDAKGE